MMKIRKYNLNVILFLILIAFMPLHNLVFSKILGNFKILSLWRDIIIVYLFAFSTRMKIRKNAMEIGIVVSIGVILFFTMTSGSAASYNIARTYCIPLLIFFYTSRKDFSKKEFDAIVKIMLIIACIISIWGLVQAFILGPEIMFKLGYSNSGGRFGSTAFYINGWSQQRVIGTFSSPNGCGAYFACMLIFLYCVEEKIKNKYLFWFSFGIIGLGLVGTFSRSAWLGCILGLACCGAIRIKHIKTRSLQILLMAIVALLIFMVLLSKTEMFSKMFNMVFSHIGRTVSKEDASFVYHVQQLYMPFLDLIGHPFGLGFGTNGSFALSHLAVEETHQVESSIWVMAFELGIVGALIYFFPYLYTIWYLRKEKKNKVMRCAVGICTCILFIYCCLPSVQSYEQSFYVMMFAGIAMKNSKKYNKGCD